jgi:hypothetical protein
MNTVLHAEMIAPEQWVHHLELSFTFSETMAKKAIDLYVSGPMNNLSIDGQ